MTTTNKIIVAGAIFLIGNLLIVYLLMLPTVKKIKNLRYNIITQKIDLENKMAKEKNLNILNDKLKLIEPDMEKLDLIFLNNNRELEFITVLEGIAGKNHIIQKINFDPTTAILEQERKKIPITLSLSGNYLDLMRYLNDIEILPYYVNITQLSLAASANPVNSSANDDSARSQGVSAALTAYTFWK